jgi:hypothetical protein
VTRLALLPSAQRTAVKQRPHQETERQQVAMSEPVVLHHGREDGGGSHDEVRPSATACWAACWSRLRSRVLLCTAACNELQLWGCS